MSIGQKIAGPATVALAVMIVLGGRVALAQGASVPPDAKPAITLDISKLPPMPAPPMREARNRAVLIATGAGAAVGILAADILTGGILLAPLGIPSVSAWFGAAAAVPAPTYTLGQRVVAGVATLAAGMRGGYLGGLSAREQSDATVR